MLLAGLPAAHAQEDDGKLEEVVVSAQKRDENLQNVPLSITALGTRSSKKCRSSEFADYAKFLPSVSYQSLGPGATAVYMRGVASGENAQPLGPAAERRHLSRRAAHHHHSGRARHPRVRHRARGVAGRSAGHAVRRELAVRHHPHHHEQAGSERVQGGLRPRGHHGRQRRSGLPR